MYKRFYKTHRVNIGNTYIGGNGKIRLQSMTNTQTSDIENSVKQCIAIIDAGADLVRLSAKNKNELDALVEIKNKLKETGYNKAVIADIHFSSSLAVKAAKVADKVRINPGNFYSKNNDDDYLQKLKENLLPLIDECKKNKTAVRIGTNHGSLSSRIINKYGTGTEAMVEATMEFVRIFASYKFKNLVLSVKASNAVENILATKLLVKKLQEESYSYPLHIGVTEAGLGEMGRIKSAVGIGALLADGIGDTIRVSLTESPEREIPIARSFSMLFDIKKSDLNIISNYNKLISLKKNKISNNIFDKANQFVLIASEKHKYSYGLYPDYYSNSLYGKANLIEVETIKDCEKIVDENSLIVITTRSKNSIYKFKEIITEILEKVEQPKIIWKRILSKKEKDYNYRFAAEMGSLISDNIINAIWIEGSEACVKDGIKIANEVLQITGLKISHADFVSCPSCSRTSFNIIDLAEEIRIKTFHLKGLTIAVMGCIVNGPGEMGNADYGIVGQSKNLLSIYHKGKQVERNVDIASVSQKLIELIKSQGDWLEVTN